MTEQDLSIQIERESQVLKAPVDLVERTKAAVAEEERKKACRKKAKLKYYMGGAVLAAAAAVFFLISPFSLGVQSEDGRPPTEQSDTSDSAAAQSETEQSGTWLRLGTVAGGQEIFLEEEVSVERVKILPMVFLKAESEDVIDGITVRYAQNEDGFWMAAFEDQSAYVVITAQVTKKQEIVEIMEEMLSAK